MLTRLALMLVLGVVVASACVAALMWWKAPAASAQQATSSSDASFVVRCDFSQRKHDDPIVFPRQRGAAHSHDFFGNRSTNYASTYKRLRAATATTCFNPADKAAYWMPTMKWGPRTLQPSHALFYYRAARKAPKEVQPHPPGLKVVTNQNSHVTWRCAEGTWATSPPTRCSNGKLVVRLRFPDCSNGKLDSADHRSHMAYAVRQSDGTWRCPTTHQKPVPALSMNVHFPLPTASGKVTLSSGAASTIHADFFNAWDQQKLAALVRSCINAYPFSAKNPKPARCKATRSRGNSGSVEGPAAAPEPAPEPNPKPTPEPAPEPNPKPTPEPTPQPNPGPSPAPNPEPAPEPSPEPAPGPAPEPAPQPAPGPA
jgi:Domain of unknown function (DUF1996)